MNCDPNDAENSEEVISLRSELRDNLKSFREDKRKKIADGIRVGIGEIGNQIENLKTYSTDDVTDIANRIKQQKHANAHDLNSLAHAFIQSAENIICFLNITGALNVLVKELTGTNANTQILAIECVCNLSLGTEIACEKLTLHTGTYLITFVNSQNERLALTSLWTLNNLAASGEKSLRILLSQELLRTLLALKEHNAPEKILYDSYNALQVIVCEQNRKLLRPSDFNNLLQWVQIQETFTNINIVKVAYKILILVEFKFNDDNDYTKIMEICVRSMVKLAAHELNMESHFNEAAVHDQADVLGLIVKIASQLCVQNGNAREHFISYGFIWPQLSMVEVFNRLFIIQTNSEYQKQLIWFVGALIKNTTSPAAIKYLEDDNFIAKIKVPIVETFQLNIK